MLWHILRFALHWESTVTKSTLSRNEPPTHSYVPYLWTLQCILCLNLEMSWTWGKKGRKVGWGLACAPRSQGLLPLEMSYWCNCTNEVWCTTSGSKNLPLLITFCFEADVKKTDLREYTLSQSLGFFDLYSYLLSLWNYKGEESHWKNKGGQGKPEEVIMTDTKKICSSVQFSEWKWRTQNWQHSSRRKQLHRQEKRALMTNFLQSGTAQ